ncbi:hypothetical protein CI664_011940 [Klebsiella quasipneumoniae subsp. similipneumoniae]|nr:hypothetical protein CI664_011940 [Klebsiella quasipneumoniae subsp. similipneumoniae]
MKTQPATGETYPKSDLFNKASYIEKGQKVTSGQLMIEFDIGAISAAGLSLHTPVIITNLEETSELEYTQDQHKVIDATKKIMSVKL